MQPENKNEKKNFIQKLCKIKFGERWVVGKKMFHNLVPNRKKEKKKN